MQSFKDPEAGSYWQFEDDVRVELSAAGREFYAPHGEKLDVPLTLVPGEMPPPEAPSVAVPTSVTPFQGLAALDAAGHLAVVEAHFNDVATPMLYRLAYQRAITWERRSPTIAYMASVMGWDDAYLDQLFISAAKII